MVPEHDSNLHRLPREPVDRFTRPFARFLQIEAAGGAVLLLFVVAAVILANSQWAAPFERIWETHLGLQIGSVAFGRSVRDWINDAGMTLFFFVVGLELKRALVLGELRDARMAALSIAGALGGMLAPAAIYLLLQWGQPAVSGWGTVMATDTAFVIGCLALLGSRVPQSLRLFMLVLAIVDDIGAVVVIALGYSSQISWVALSLAALGVAGVTALARLGIRHVPIYYLAGALIWLALDASGIHATLTGVAMALLTPARRWVSDDRLYAILSRVVAHPTSHEVGKDTEGRETLRLAERAARETLSPVERLEWALHPWVGFVIMPMFALANAGLPLVWNDLSSPVTVTVIVAFVLGKPIGVMTFCWIALRFGIARRPAELRWELLGGGAALAGIGFTMAIFIANLAFLTRVLASVKLGIFSASVISAVAGLTLLLWGTRRAGHPKADSDTH